MNTSMNIAFLNSYRRKQTIYSLMRVACPGQIIILFVIITTENLHLARIESPVMSICVYISKIVVDHAKTFVFQKLSLCSRSYDKNEHPIIGTHISHEMVNAPIR